MLCSVSDKANYAKKVSETLKDDNTALAIPSHNSNSPSMPVVGPTNSAHVERKQEEKASEARKDPLRMSLEEDELVAWDFDDVLYLEQGEDSRA